MSNSKQAVRTAGRRISHYLFVLFPIGVALTSCGTMMALHADAPKEFARTPDLPCSWPRLYSGISLDIYAVKQNSQIGAILFWDIPLSLAMDTIVLPITAFLQIRDGSFKGAKWRCPESGSISEPTEATGRSDAAPLTLHPIPFRALIKSRICSAAASGDTTIVSIARAGETGAS